MGVGKQEEGAGMGRGRGRGPGGDEGRRRVEVAVAGHLYRKGNPFSHAYYCCKRTSEESETIGGRKEKEFVDDDLTTGKHPTI